MRLKTYITEAGTKISAEELFADIKKKCKPYLTLLKGKQPLFRGLHDPSAAKVTEPFGIGYGIKKVRKDRTPKGTLEKDFKILNKWLAGNGHARRDQSISVTAAYDAVSFFGKPSWVFPIGKFDYSWVKAVDFNYGNEKIGFHVYSFDIQQATIYEFLRAYYNGTLDSRTKKADLAQFITTNKEFIEAYRKKYEIWIDCKEYYYVLLDSLTVGELNWKSLAEYLK